MFRTLRSIAAAATLTLALTACSSADDDPVAGVPAFPIDAPSVTLVNPGENPDEVRYSPAAEWDTSVAVSSGVDQHVAAPGEAEDANAPAGGDVNKTTLPLTVTAGEAPAPEGDEEDADSRIDFVVGSGKHSDLDIGQDVAASEGFRMSWRADDTGRISTLKLLAPADAPQRGLQLVEPTLIALINNSVVFPDEPIGPGATWTVEGRVAGDTAMTRTTTYTLVSRDGDALTLDTKVEERPQNNTVTVDGPGELEGESVQVDSSRTTSEGQIVVDLSHPLPVSGQTAWTTRLIYGENDKARVVQDITRAVQYGA